MNIVVLDGYTLNPGDLTWDELSALGTLTVYERTATEDIVKRAAGADVVLTNKTPLSAETIGQLQDLKYIGVLATGYNIVNIEAAAKQGIIVTNVPDYSTFSVVQLVFAFLLERCHHVKEHSDAVHSGRWSAGPDFMFSLHPLYELSGKTMGIIGFGQIGQQVARAASAFGMDICVHTRTPKQAAGLEHVRFVSVDELFAQSDIVTLHCPLTDETAGIVSSRTLELMKPSAFIINTARGGHIVEQDLADALRRGQIAGAALDVLSVEPPPANHPLLDTPNCYITPHIGWATVDARQRLMSIASANLRSFMEGNAVNRV
ncbi:D-2-hydroxyacid dehydrogenase [Paenibacillus sp. sptzw28]|uniref:D-2-hydroxyacid dehydrogenase n=1 Tax=Paenibacillus sp. sptzw28 TaxID=715179 RepID=UPI001C6E118F|nr:D-2-hydroxyacid dehydrogenase [Paenibacillus sp. sptzw28]QYR19826.1 D-2-hydroxyacid dehydrogenase [Paenibacillus sp. sptzw28]